MKALSRFVVCAAAVAATLADADWSSSGDEMSSSSSSSGDGYNEPMTWAPTTAPWTSGDWRWDSSRADGSSSSSSSSGSSDGDEAGVEIFYPGLDGSIEHAKRNRYSFDPKQGFSMSTLNLSSDPRPAPCGRAEGTCVHVLFESDYGAMSTVDAFYLHSYESAHGPVMSNSWEVGGQAPLVWGRLSRETVARLGANWGEVWNWNDSRRTVWTIYSPTNEVDLTLHLRQVLTLFAGYDISRNESVKEGGPFYSGDLRDQLAIRLNGHTASSYASTSAVLPIVAAHAGSKLIDVNLTTSTLCSSGYCNELLLTVKLTRRKFGGVMPWYPISHSYDYYLPNALKTCLADAGLDLPSEFRRLLEHKQDSFDVQPYLLNCSREIPSRYSNLTDGELFWSQVSGHSISYPAEWDNNTVASYLVDRIDNAIRVQAGDFWLYPWSDPALKSYGEVVRLYDEPQVTFVRFGDQNYSFYLELEVDGWDQTLTATTPVFTSDMPGDSIASTIKRVFVNTNALYLHVSVSKYDNLKDVWEAEQRNRKMVESYEMALHWARAGSSVRSSGDGSSGVYDTGRSQDSAASSMVSAADSGFAQPGRPDMDPVPSKVYTVEITFRNVTIVPRIKAVFSDSANVSTSTRNATLQFDTIPFSRTRLVYQAPPSDLDLDVEPAWVRNVRRRLPEFAEGDGCGTCMDVFQACLFDEDCAFGVNQYMFDALQPSRLATKWKYGKGEWVADVTSILRESKPFFPTHGFDKFARLLLCWSSSNCQLNDPSAGSPTRTWLSFSGSGFTVTAQVGANITITRNDQQFKFSVTAPDQHEWKEGETRFRDFLLNEVFLGADPDERSLSSSLGVMLTDQAQYFVNWYPMRKLIDAPRVDASDGVSVEYRNWSAGLHTETYPTLELDDSVRVARLVDWLDLFRAVPFGNTPRNATTPPPASPPSSICVECATQWHACVASSSCFRAAQMWLPRVLPRGWESSYTFDWNNELVNSNETAQILPGEIREMVFRTLRCFSNYQCAVGYSPTDSGTMVPTFVRMTATQRFPFRVGSHITRLYYAPLNLQLPLWQVVSCEELFSELNWFFSHIRQHDPRASIGAGLTAAFDGDLTNCSGSFVLSGPAAVMKNIFTQDPESGSAVTYSIWFESVTEKATWSFLLSWFDLPPLPPPNGSSSSSPSTSSSSSSSSTSSSWSSSSWSSSSSMDGDTGSDNATVVVPESDVCLQCLPKLYACLNDNDCWHSVHDIVLLIIQQTRLWTYNDGPSHTPDGHTLYAVDLGDALSRLVLFKPWLNAFATATSWELFVDFVECLMVTACDVSSTDAATTSPATAHVPSLLRIQPGSAGIRMYPGTRLEVTFQETRSYFTHRDAWVPDQLAQFLRQAFGPTVPIRNVSTRVDPAFPNGFTYLVSYDTYRLWHMPTMTFNGGGPFPPGEYHTTDMIWWRLSIESVARQPQWDKLVRFLSLTPPSRMAPNTTAFDCPAAETAKRACFSSFDCHFLVANSVVPYLTNALTTKAPAYRQDDLFEIDLTPTFESQVLWHEMFGTIEGLMRIFRASTSCPPISVSPVATLVFEDMRVHFTRPAVGPLLVEYQNRVFTLHDELPEHQGPTKFDALMRAQFVDSITAVGAILLDWALENDTIRYDVLFTKLYHLPPPHFAWVDPITQRRLDSVDSPYKLAFRASSYQVYDAVASWIAWLRAAPIPEK